MMSVGVERGCMKRPATYNARELNIVLYISSFTCVLNIQVNEFS